MGHFTDKELHDLAEQKLVQATSAVNMTPEHRLALSYQSIAASLLLVARHGQSFFNPVHQEPTA